MNDMRGGELVKPQMTFGKGMAEGWRGERRGTGEQLVCACVSVCFCGLMLMTALSLPGHKGVS